MMGMHQNDDAARRRKDISDMVFAEIVNGTG